MPPKTVSCQTCVQLVETINELKQIMSSLKAEVESLNTRVAESDATNCFRGFQFEEVIQEATERINRKQNLIIYGIPEQSSSIPSERQTRDTTAVKDVLAHLSPNIDIDNIKPVRLGKYDSTRDSSRAIKIRLNEERAVYQLLGKAKNLKDSARYARINISPDRTRKQIEYYQTLKDELARRTESGETNLKIKYINGIPRIVSLN